MTASKKPRNPNAAKEELSLPRFARELAAATNLDHLAQIIRSQTEAVFEWDAFFLTVRRSGQTKFQMVVKVDTVDGRKQQFDARRGGFIGQGVFVCLTRGEPLLINRTDEELAPTIGLFGDTKRPSASLLFAPIRMAGEVLGIISVQSYTKNKYDVSSRRLLQSLADLASPALQRCQAEVRGAAFSSLGKRLSSANTPRETALIVIEVADTLLGWDACSVDLYTAEDSRMLSVLNVDIVDGERKIDLPKGHPDGSLSPTARKVITEGAQLVVREATSQYDQELATFGDQSRRSATLMFAPIRSGPRVVGMLSIQSYTYYAYDRNDLATLQALADHCGGAFERARAQEELYRSNARFAALVDSSEDYIYVIDRDMRYLHCNRAVEKRFRVSPHQQVGRTLSEILGPEKAEFYARHVREVYDTGKPVRYEDSRMLFGNYFCSETVLSPIFDRDGNVEAVTGVSRDITERRLAEQALRESEERLALAIKGSNDGLWDWNLKTNEVYYSPRWKEMLGYEDHELSSEPAEWFSRIHPQDGARVQSELDAHLKEPLAFFESEYRILHKDGSYRWMLARGTSIRDAEGRATRVAGSQSDITVRKAAEEQLVRGAYHDALTGLPNRILFTESLTRSVARAKRRSDYRFAVLFLDLDRFKIVNDSLGHAIGDQLLVHVARRLEECMRPGDIVARLGGDEFTVLLEDIADAANAVQIAERILARVSMPLSLSGHEVYSTVSIGIALSSASYEAAEDLIRDADSAMYRAKSLGKARYELFAEKQRDTSLTHAHTESELRRAVARRQFELRYMPVVQLDTGSVCGFEALLRWQHPTRGLLGPAEFLKLADESGLLIPIGWWTIKEAAGRLAAWNQEFPSAPPLRVSVNLTARQFNHPALISLISHTVSRSRLPSQSLVLEIAESAVSTDWQSLIEQTSKLRQLQVQLHLDNFGAGTSSLSFLNRVLVDALKIDRSFVMRLGPTGENRGILKAIMAIAQELRIPAIAEGIETAAQVSTLKSLGCSYGQGYHYAEPLTADEATRLLAQSPHFTL